MSGPAFSLAMLLLGAPPASEAASPPPQAAVATADPAAPQAAPVAPPPPAQAERQDEEIVVTGRRHDPGDPLEGINAESFAVTQAIDTAVIRPVAKTYQRILPAPLRDGIRNILNNLREPVTFVNNLAQFKIGRAARTFGRFAVNSTIGVAGLVDVARRKPFRIERKVNGFGNTLGYYGVKTGIFFYLPIIGPTTVRDLIGTTVDRIVLPFAVGKPFDNPAFTLPAGALGTLDNRAQFDETLEALHHDTPDAYVATREFYLARRQAEIDELHGKGRKIVKPTPGSVKPQIIPAPTR